MLEQANQTKIKAICCWFFFLYFMSCQEVWSPDNWLFNACRWELFRKSAKIPKSYEKFTFCDNQE